MKSQLLFAIIVSCMSLSYGAMVDSFLEKKYKLESSDNFEDFLKALDIGYLIRKAAMFASPTVYLTRDGANGYLFRSESTFSNTDLKFVDGVEFEQNTPDGRKVQSKITVDGNVLHEKQVEPNNRTTYIDRIFSDSQLIMEMKVVHDGKETKSKRVYKAD